MATPPHMLGLVLAAVLTAPLLVSAATNISEYRLPSDHAALEYRLSVLPDPSAGSFSAAAALRFTPNVPYCFCLLLNSHRLDYDYSSLRLRDTATDTHVVIDRLVVDQRLQRLALFPSKPLVKGVVYELIVSYQGIISDDGLGVYRTQYKDKQQRDRWMTVTQLRPVYARRLFPCFDEPIFKAAFQLKIWHQPDEFVLSNTKPIRTDKDGVFSVTTFEKTPVISTFLVGFIVSAMECVSTGPFSSYAVAGKEAGVAYSAEVGPAMASAMEQLLDIPYPQPKTDQVALPRLIPVAMENWALFNFREGNILYFPGQDKTVQKQTAARYSGHEITHAWMGNSVTLKWWDYLWLSEAFAMYYEYYLPGVVEPSWNMMGQMVVDLTQFGLHLDSMSSTPPLTTTLLTPDEIAAKFMGITYFKGPSLIRMVSHVLGERRYVEGFSTFLRENWLGNVEPRQLWDTLERVATQRLPGPLAGLMHTWTNSPGYPVVTATRDYSTDILHLSQKRFLLDGDAEVDNTTWWIPISMTSRQEAQFCCPEPHFWFKPQPQQRIKLEQIRDDDWIILNILGSGFYRVNYDERNWRSIINQLYSSPGVVGELSRSALIDDSLALARAGQLSHAVALDLAKYLSSEEEYVPWAAALKASSLPFYHDILLGSYLHDYIKAYLLSLTDEIYSLVGFEEKPSDGHLDKLLRELIVRWACRAGNKDCILRSKGYLASLSRRQNVKISVDVVDTALCTAISNGGDKEWLLILSLYDSADDEADRKRYLNALACTNDVRLTSLFLEKSIGELSAEMWGARFSAFAARSENADRLLDILVNSQAALDNRFGGASFVSYVDQISSFLQTPEQNRKVQSFAQFGADVSAAQTAVGARLGWLKKHGAHLRDYFLQSALVV